MAITAKDVQNLRSITGVGMMDCKKALTEANGDVEAAIKLLRERGVAVAAKRAEKEAKQGVVTIKSSDDGKKLVMVEVNCETDFVARNSDFGDFVNHVADVALTCEGNVADVLSGELTDKIAAIGENMKIRRSEKYSLNGNGILSSYIHMGGKIGVMIEVACGKPESMSNDAFKTAAHDICLQIAALAPQYVKPEDVPADVLDAERAIYAKQLEGEKKPENIKAKIVEGKLNKFYGEVCLVKQVYVKDDSLTIEKLLQQAGKECNDSFTVVRFVRYQLGA